MRESYWTVYRIHDSLSMGLNPLNSATARVKKNDTNPILNSPRYHLTGSLVHKGAPLISVSHREPVGFHYFHVIKILDRDANDYGLPLTRPLVTG